MRIFYKFFVVLLITLFTCLVLNIYVLATENNQMLEYHKLTQEEIGSDISIPNRQGDWDTYGDIYTFEDLYSVLEDLIADYRNLVEEYNSLESQYEELERENEELHDEIYKLENNYENDIDEYTLIDNNIDYSWLIIVGIIIIIYIVSKKQNK